MTSLPKVISFFLLILVSLIIFSRSTLAQYLLSPIVESNNNQPISNDSINNTEIQQYNNDVFPQTSFGDLLNNTSTATPASDDVNCQLSTVNCHFSSDLSPSKISAFLQRLNLSSEEAARTLAEFLANQKSTVNKSPLIPLPTLVATVESLITPSPVYTPQIAAILEKEKQEKVLGAIDESQPMADPPLAETNQPINNEPVTIDQLPVTNTSSNYTDPTKLTYTIALLGDSMVDTLGPDLPILRKLLINNFPGRNFALLNYGQGSTDMESGLYRLTNYTTYLEQLFPPLLSYKPDIIVIESFAYNHWSGELHDLNRQWLTIAKMIDTIKAQSAGTRIILAATIGPNPNFFGDGVLNWTESKIWDATIITKAYLQNMINFATSQQYPLVDAYHPSLNSENHGSRRYINTSDNIHPSEEGKTLFSQKIIDTIKKENMIR